MISVQSSVLVLNSDLDDPECGLEIEGCLVDRNDMSDVSFSVSEADVLVPVPRCFPRDFLDDLR